MVEFKAPHVEIENPAEGFDELFSNFDSDVDYIDRIALAIYHYSTNVGVSENQLISLFANSDVHLSMFALKRYLDELENKNYIKKTSAGGYRLTTAGRGAVQKHRTHDGDTESARLVDIGDLQKEEWEELGQEINEAYEQGLHSAAAVLYRTLIEDILYIILNRVEDDEITPYTDHQQNGEDTDTPKCPHCEAELSVECPDCGGDIDSNTNQDPNPESAQINRESYKLSELISEFEVNADRFMEYIRNPSQTAETLDKMRELGNDGAHGTRYNPSASKLGRIDEDANDAVADLMEINRRLEEESDNEDEESTEFPTEAVGEIV